MNGHTPGPWHVEDDTAVYSSASFVADCHDAKSMVSTNAEYANARLIAAAPELLEACERGDKLIQLWRETGKPNLHAFTLLQDAFRIVSAKAAQS